MARVFTKAYVHQPRKPKRQPRPMVFPYTRTTSVVRRLWRYIKTQEVMSNPPTLNWVQTFFGSRSRTGTALPNWRDIIKAGGNATTLLSAYEDVLEAQLPMMRASYLYRPNASVKHELRESLDSSFLNWFITSPLAPHGNAALNKEAEFRATSELYKKIRKAHHQLQGGVILGEIDKTARLLASTAKNLKKGIFSYLSKAVGIRQGKGTWKSKKKAIANTYLEAVFGWQPLVGDAQDLAKTLGRLTFETDRSSFKAIGGDEVQTSKQVFDVSFWHLYGGYSSYTTESTTVIYRGFLQTLPYEAGSPPLERIISMSGFDWRSFVPTMWELVPYSFVVDYFTNIGDALYALSTDTSPVHGLWRTQIKETTTVQVMVPQTERSKASIYSSAPKGDILSVIVTGQAGSVTIKRRDVSRSVASMPTLLPRFTGIDLPWKQFMNLGALISASTVHRAGSLRGIRI